MRRRFAILTVLCLTAACAEQDPGSQQGEHREHQQDAAFDEAMWAEIEARCTPAAEDEAILYGNEFSWGYDRESMAARFADIYGSGMRLLDRAYFEQESGTFVLKTVDAWGSRVTMPKRLIENVTQHIERGLALGYVDHVFFPDMGHSHFFIPQARWEEAYAGVPVPQMAERNSRLLDDPSLLVLYHTAEQLQMLDDEDNLLSDPWVQWRFHTRNLVGDNAGLGRTELLREPDSKANTARDYPGHHYFGAGFNISASADGCFPYEHDGKLEWYDLSLSDLPHKPSGDGGDFY